MAHWKRGELGDAELDFVSEVDDLEELYSPEYLRDCAAGGARQERLEELRRRIVLRTYRVDADTIAGEMLRREFLPQD